ncbi:MMPL family transporter [Lederbergia lenta]|uniref:Membrane protein, MmpL family n=1 Tax=Lederbergia lenta TaxID=1467 RepID=A0A2X4WF45_LEDLE|nr:MMPL family transporter [Lederbergia lenta]MCM3112235.1 MMPL family transporter [Lederbergia lenta]SQI63357.1 membrane protein, MmpL family [Lederbergia lenta]
MKRGLTIFLESIVGKRGRWITLGIWAALAVFLTILWPSVQSAKNNAVEMLPEDTMSVQAAKLVKEEFSDEAGLPLLLVWHKETGLAEEDTALIIKLYEQLTEKPLAQQSFIPPLHKAPPQALFSSASENGSTIVTPIFLDDKAESDLIQKDIDDLKEVIKKIADDDLFSRNIGEDDLLVRVTGPAGISTDAVSLFSEADVKLLIATVLLVLILLIVLYRSPILAIVPLIGVGFAYAVISPILGVLADKGWIIVDSQAISIMTVLLFGAGTDYCLFLVSRYRDHLLMEENALTALKNALKDSGGAIMISALTTAFGLLTLLLALYGSYHTFAVPFSLAIFIMGLAALTLLPALLSIFGRVSFFPFIPRTDSMSLALEKTKGKAVRRQKSHGKFSIWLGKFVTRKPWPIICATLILLGGLATFSTKIDYTYDLLSSFPDDMPSREGFELINENFSAGNLAPMQIIVDTSGKAVQLEEQLSDLTMIESIGESRRGSNNNDLLLYEIILKENPYDAETLNHIPTIKEKVSEGLTQAGITPAEEHFWIGGETANLYDTKMTTDRDRNIVVPAVIAIIALLLLVYLRSIVAMIYLLLTVLLSYFSALGAGWLLMHYGMGTEAMQGLIPLYTFVFIVALGEDYNIFMVSSIWKKRRTQPLQEAIANGVTETSSVITSAGLILAGTFAVLATLPIQVLVQFGIVTAIGILLDTFIVRPLLVPAITSVLGKYAFWPGKLGENKEKEQ